MSFDPLAVTTVPADEEWDETLDSLARAAARDMADRGLITDDAEDATRYHIRGFGRRLVNPLLDQVRTELRSGQHERSELSRENARLRAWAATVARTRRRDLRFAMVLGILWTMLVVAIGILLHTRQREAPAPAPPPAAQAAPTAPAGPAAPAR